MLYMMVFPTQLLLIIFTMVLLHAEVETVIKMKKDYIKNPWNCIQVITVAQLCAIHT